jgi:hypothetical protein
MHQMRWKIGGIIKTRAEIRHTKTNSCDLDPSAISREGHVSVHLHNWHTQHGLIEENQPNVIDKKIPSVIWMDHSKDGLSVVFIL